MVGLALNQLVRRSVSTYYGPLDDEGLWEYVKENLDELCHDGMVKIKKDNKITECPIGEIRIDIDYDNRREVICPELAKDFQDAIESNCWNISEGFGLEEILKMYGLLYHGMNFWMPHAYNYNNDELGIVLTEDEFEDDCLPPRQETNPELIPLVEKYIKEVRQESYDGYCSFEPTDVNKVDRLDYAYLWAVLQKEGLYEKIQEAIDDVIIDGIARETIENHAHPHYDIMYKDGDYTCWDEYVYSGDCLEYNQTRKYII